VLAKLDTLMLGSKRQGELNGLVHPTLRVLKAWNAGIKDVAGIALPNVEEIDLSMNKIRDLSTLAQSSKLRHLRLQEVPVKDGTFLAELAQLETLYIDKLCDIEPLAGLTALRKLTLGAGVKELSALAGLHALEVLFLGYRGKEIAPLAGLTALKELYLANAPSDLTPLQNLKQLYHLVPIDLASKLSLKQAPERPAPKQYVDQPEAVVSASVPYGSTLDPLRGCPNLRSVTTSHDPSLDLSALSELSVLSLKHEARIEALSDLPHCPNFTTCLSRLPTPG
jgi:Leucine-rich repeat (LRR) protein